MSSNSKIGEHIWSENRKIINREEAEINTTGNVITVSLRDPTKNPYQTN